MKIWSVWASYAGTQQKLVDKVSKQFELDSSTEIELVQFRKCYVDEDGRKLTEDQLKHGEQITRLTNEIAENPAVVFFLCDDFIHRKNCLAELLAVLWHKRNCEYAAVVLSKKSNYADLIINALCNTDLEDFVWSNIIRQDDFVRLSHQDIKQRIQSRLEDEIYYSGDSPSDIKANIEGFIKAKLKKQPAFDLERKFKDWLQREGLGLKEHFDAHSDPDGSCSSEHIAKHLFGKGDTNLFVGKLVPRLQEFRRKYIEKSYSRVTAIKEANDIIRTFGGYFSLLIFNRDWVAQRNCGALERVHVNLRLPESNNNPLFLNVIMAGVANKIPLISIDDEVGLRGDDRLFTVVQNPDAGSTDEAKREYCFRLFGKSLWSVLVELGSEPDVDATSDIYLSPDNRGKLIGNYNNRFGKGADRFTYIEIDQTTYGSLPYLIRYLDEFLNILNKDVKDDPQEAEIHIPTLLFRIDATAHVNNPGYRTKLSMLTDIIRLANEEHESKHSN